MFIKPNIAVCKSIMIEQTKTNRPNKLLIILLFIQGVPNLAQHEKFVEIMESKMF